MSARPEAMVYDCRVAAPVDLLKRVPLFQGLKDRELKSLAAAFTTSVTLALWLRLPLVPVMVNV